MALSPSDQFGPYQLISAIGRGGMGEVWKARDTRLDRIVAMKFSQEKFSERFEREAKAISSLNHPNICQLYDVGPNYLVMEYVEGSQLKGPLPLDQALKCGAQICDALDHAHKKGITHRDLKPANILVTKQGIKLLDFGLAKFASSGLGQAPGPDDATVTMALTGKNEIVGTLYYMSPEQLQAQANGQEIDGRSDIFSFGIVLYEILTGKRAFEGSSPASVIAAIMERPAPSIADVAPPALDRVLKKCLAKDPDERWQTARDLKDELDWIASAPESGSAVAAAPTNSGSRFGKWSGIAVAVMTVVAASLGIVAYLATRPVEQALRPLVRLDVDLGPDVSLDSPYGADQILSRDGTRMVYVSQGRLFTRRLDQPNPTELAGTQGAFAPFFSPDGQWVAFFAGTLLQKISVDGGSPITVSDAPAGRGGSWSEDGNIIAALSTGGRLSRIPSAGGPPTPVTELQNGEETHRWPQILPGGKAVLFTASRTRTAFDAANIEVMSLADHSRKTLVRGGTYGRYLPSGYLVYVNQDGLFAVPFDADRLEVYGTPVPVLDQISYNAGQGSAQLDFSQTGTLIYRSGAAGGGLLTVAWLDGAGKVQPLLSKPGSYSNPSLSPDGQRLALEVTEGSGSDVWVYDWQRDTMTRLTFTGTVIKYLWSPDGRYIVFGPAPGEGISVIRSDGASKPQPLTQSKTSQYPYSFAPDRKRLAFHQSSPGTRLDLWTVPMDSDSAGLRAGKPEVFLQTTAAELYPSFSPDGRWIAYASDESGTRQLYVRAFPDKGGKWQISNNGGAHPMWSSNGRELFFVTADNHIMVAAYAVKGDSFVADKPRLWTERQIGDAGGHDNFAVAPDGKRIVALMPVETTEAQKAQNHLIFLENFSDELRRKIPVGK